MSLFCIHMGAQLYCAVMPERTIQTDLTRKRPMGAKQKPDDIRVGCALGGW